MRYRKLGNSELAVSEISLGCMSLGKDHAENAKIIQKGIDLGINFFDTADLYAKGLNEESLGKALKNYRKKVLIATKVGNKWRPDGEGWDWMASKSYIMEAVYKSLDRLQTDYIDLYQLHGGTLEDPIEECIEAFELLKEKGLIRYYGISSIRPSLIQAWVKKSNLSSVMTQYSLLDRRPEEFSLDFLHAHNVSVLVRGALAKGLLVQKPAAAYLSYPAEEVNLAQAAISRQENSRRSKAQVALQYCLGHDAVTSIVAGASSVAQITENAESSDALPLELSERIDLQTSIRPIQYQKHRQKED